MFDTISNTEFYLVFKRIAAFSKSIRNNKKQGCPYRFWRGGGTQGGHKGPMGVGVWCVIPDKIVSALLQKYKPLIMSYIWVNQQYNGAN